MTATPSFWAEEQGTGPTVLFLHGSLEDARLWAPVARILAKKFHCIRYDQRFFGGSTGPAEEWSPADDAVTILNRFGIEPAALVGLSGGGGIALDVALAHPDRVWAIAHVAGAVAGMPFDLPSPIGVDPHDAMAVDFAIWAPLGADETMRDMWLATPNARGLPEGARPRPRPSVSERLGEISVPSLVVVAKHDPPTFTDVGRTVARPIPGARLVEVDSDHYLTLRRSEEVGQLLLEFLATGVPAQEQERIPQPPSRAWLRLRSFRNWIGGVRQRLLGAAGNANEALAWLRRSSANWYVELYARTERGMGKRTRKGHRPRQPMALLHQATLKPGKLTLLKPWLSDRRWSRILPGAALEYVTSCRFDDPAGAVGIEAMLVRAGDGPIHHIPLTYRDAPLEGGEGWLIGTPEHSVLGRRWIYDACGDPRTHLLHGRTRRHRTRVWWPSRVGDGRPTRDCAERPSTWPRNRPPNARAGRGYTPPARAKVRPGVELISFYYIATCPRINISGERNANARRPQAVRAALGRVRQTAVSGS